MNPFIWGLFVSTLILFLLTAAFLYILLQYRLRVSVQQHEASMREQEYQDRLLFSSIAAQENERKRIAADLHDDLGALLALVAWYVDGALRHVPEGGTAAELMLRSRQLLDLAMNQVKRIAYDMAPYGLEETGLEEAIKRLLERMDVPRHLKISVSFRFPRLRLPLPQEVMLFRVLQELFNNIQKHSHASFIKVVQLYADGIYQLLVEHDGVGLIQEKFDELRRKESSIGLQNIYSRIKTSGGQIRFYESKGRYTTGIELSLACSNHLQDRQKLLYGLG